MNNQSPTRVRLSYIDWLRGLACVLMFQTHCYDAWLSPDARRTDFFTWSQLIGSFPAPLFLFLAGVSFAFVVDKLRQKSLDAGAIARTTIKRGAEILGLGLLFRFQQWSFNWRWSPWTDIFRVDILNTIGVSMMLMGVLCWLVASISNRSQIWGGTEAGQRLDRLRNANLYAAFIGACAISLLTPPLWTTHRPRFLPWPLQSYIDGVHTFAEPQSWLFPIFPWAGFAFAGLALGFVLLSGWVKRHQTPAFALLGVAGVALIYGALWFDRQPSHLYAVYDFWTHSPEFFFLRVGILLIFMMAAYAWCRWGWAEKGFSPLIQLGQTSLLVYWVHIEFVYDRLTILPGKSNSIPRATLGFLFITVFMLVLSMLRTRWKSSGFNPRLAGLIARLRSKPESDPSATAS